MATSNGKIRLSPSALNIYLECQKCFWLEYKAGIHRPRGPFPSLPGGMDILIKKYFDSYRAVGKLPPEIVNQVTGDLLPDIEVLSKWRSWRSGLSYYDKDLDAVLVGALDDCLVNEGKYIPVDYKTRGFDITEGGESFYQNQLNCYSFLLAANEFKQPSYAYLIYFIPREVKIGGSVIFSVEVKKVSTSIEAARKTFEKAALLLRGEAPTSHSECQFCSWSRNISAV
ncbi:MAG TPA: PD-(D/E)XK nuclease family protein [Candidatus Paceibacterota bacterium]